MFTLGLEVGLDTITPEVADVLSTAVKDRKNLIIAGRTNSGRTTLLRALCNEIPPSERLITVERFDELKLNADPDHGKHPFCVPVVQRPDGPSLLPHHGPSMRQLLQTNQDLKPDRVIVGEVLGDEIVTMLYAMALGEYGAMSTIHANSAHDAVERIVAFGARAPERLPREEMLRLIAAGLDYIVVMRTETRDDISPEPGAAWPRRMVVEVVDQVGVDEHGDLVTNTIWNLDASQARIGIPPTRKGGDEEPDGGAP